ncbi:MAG: hypothetical protein N2376_01030, partial [Clostridia bacterium]|nr:hypothetical protein [Clostridia bacterium]
DKQEFPEHTVFICKYYNGSITSMVKKEDRKKLFSAGVGAGAVKTDGAEQPSPITLDQKGGENKMNENVMNMHETLGISYSKGELTAEEVMANLAEKFGVAVHEVPPNIGPVNLFMTKEQAAERLGKELSCEQVLKLAKEGQDYHESLVKDALSMGVKAMGNDFAVETWETALNGMENQSIKDIMKNWETQAKNLIPAGRHTDPSAGLEGLGKRSNIPDDAYTVGK